MPTLSGTFSGTVTSQASLPVDDQPNHELLLAQVRGPQTSSDPLWNDAIITYSAQIDLVNGAGNQRGYFINTRTGGDADYGNFDGVITPTADGLSCEGTWRITGGTGRFLGTTGRGTFRMKMAGRNVQTTWEGAYELGGARSQAAQAD